MMEWLFVVEWFLMVERFFMVESTDKGDEFSPPQMDGSPVESAEGVEHDRRAPLAGHLDKVPGSQHNRGLPDTEKEARPVEDLTRTNIEFFLFPMMLQDHLFRSSHVDSTLL